MIAYNAIVDSLSNVHGILLLLNFMKICPQCIGLGVYFCANEFFAVYHYLPPYRLLEYHSSITQLCYLVVSSIGTSRVFLIPQYEDNIM